MKEGSGIPKITIHLAGGGYLKKICYRSNMPPFHLGLSIHESNIIM